jgi:hypothetical protein
MKPCRKMFASILLALALGMPVCASDVNSTPTYVPPPPPIAAGTPADHTSNCSGNEALPSVVYTATELAINLLSSMLSIY